MDGSSRRKHERVTSRQLADCTCFDDNSQLSKQTLGRTLNISVSGILLETHSPLETEQPIKVTLGIQDNLIEIEGRIVHSQKNDRGVYTYGIEFSDIEPLGKDKLAELLQTIDIKSEKAE